MSFRVAYPLTIERANYMKFIAHFSPVYHYFLLGQTPSVNYFLPSEWDLITKCEFNLLIWRFGSIWPVENKFLWSNCTIWHERILSYYFSKETLTTPVHKSTFYLNKFRYSDDINFFLNTLSWIIYFETQYLREKSRTSVIFHTPPPERSSAQTESFRWYEQNNAGLYTHAEEEEWWLPTQESALGIRTTINPGPIRRVTSFAATDGSRNSIKIASNPCGTHLYANDFFLYMWMCCFGSHSNNRPSHFTLQTSEVLNCPCVI